MKAIERYNAEGRSFGQDLQFQKMEMPYVAQTVLLGGNVRVGLEDNLYIYQKEY